MVRAGVGIGFDGRKASTSTVLTASPAVTSSVEADGSELCSSAFGLRSFTLRAMKASSHTIMMASAAMMNARVFMMLISDFVYLRMRLRIDSMGVTSLVMEEDGLAICI